MKFTLEERKYLMNLARNTIKARLEGKKEIELEGVPEKFKKDGACFVTLHKDKMLRGCIGSLTASKALYRDVISNAVNAAFFDPRFSAVALDELDKIDIEISILSEPRKLSYRNANDLIKKIKKEYGIIIKKGMHTATFLPSVWEEIKEKEEFLSHLCLKAGLYPGEWENNSLEVYYYTVDVVK